MHVADRWHPWDPDCFCLFASPTLDCWLVTSWPQHGCHRSRCGVCIQGEKEGEQGVGATCVPTCQWSSAPTSLAPGSTSVSVSDWVLCPALGGGLTTGRLARFAAASPLRIDTVQPREEWVSGPFHRLDNVGLLEYVVRALCFENRFFSGGFLFMNSGIYRL